ncbi:Protein phosphatase 2C 1, partial [Lobosporangium transversale]
MTRRSHEIDRTTAALVGADARSNQHDLQDQGPSQNQQPHNHHNHNHHNHNHNHHHHHHHSQQQQGSSNSPANTRQRPGSTSEKHDPMLATAISSTVIENCDSPDDTSSIEGSTMGLADSETPPTSNNASDLQCVLKDLEEYEFVVGVAEDRNRRCRRTMEDTHAFIYNYEGITGHGFFAIFDGHAGKAAADWCGQHFHE